jgi:hypothetical protein
MRPHRKQVVGILERAKTLCKSLCRHTQILTIISVLCGIYAVYAACGALGDAVSHSIIIAPTAIAQNQSSAQFPSSPTQTLTPSHAHTTPPSHPMATPTPRLLQPVIHPTQIVLAPTPTSIIVVPTSTPTIKPPAATVTPQPHLSIAEIEANAVDYTYGTVIVQTLPGAALDITVTYCSGDDATSRSLQGTVYAGSNGRYEWDWTPETKCRGTATAAIGASWQGQEESISFAFDVQ